MRVARVWVGIDRFCLDRFTQKATADAPVVVATPTEYPQKRSRLHKPPSTRYSDPRRMASLNARKVAFESAFKSGEKTEKIDRSEWWTTSDGRALDEEVEKAKCGLFFGIK